MMIRRIALFGAFTLLFGAIGTALAADPSGISSELERTATTTAAEKVAYAEASNAEISEAVATIATLLKSAGDGSIEARQCLSSRLFSASAEEQTSASVLQQVSKAAEVAMKDAIALGQAERADHEFRKIAVAVSKTRSLLAEAQQCLADQTSDDGITNVTFFVEEKVIIVGEDGNEIDDIEIGIDPPQGSPF